MWSIIASWGLKLLNLNKTYLLIGGVVGALALGGYGGYQLAKAKYIDEKVEALENLIDQYEKQNEENREIDSSILEDLESIDREGEVIIERVIEYVERNPSNFNCELDADGLLLWNSASQD